MERHKVTVGQTLWDIAILLHGSIEGIFDLLISNDELDMTTDLTPGQELNYHPSFIINQGIIDELDDMEIIPANGECRVFYKNIVEPMRTIVETEAGVTESTITMSGDGVMLIDWGDNSDPQRITLHHSDQTITHHFNDKAEKHRIKIYGSFELMRLDVSELGGAIKPIGAMLIDELVQNGKGYNLIGWALCNTVKVNLANSTIKELTPLIDMNLQELDLRGATYTTDVIDDYLELIVADYGERYGCCIRMDSMPGERGLEAIQTILNEPEWNNIRQWEFYINNELYKV
jgi:hypothetical protein